MLKAKYFLFNPLQARCTVLWGESGDCLVFDPCCKTESERKQLLDFIGGRGLKPKAVLLTHGHYDHIYGVAMMLREFPGIKAYMSRNDEMYVSITSIPNTQFSIPSPDCNFDTLDVSDGDTFEIDGHTIETLATPGHSRGSVCYVCREEKILISGDTLFAGTIGRTDLPGGDYDQLMKSIMEKILPLDGDTDVLPGHGPCTTIADERLKNPFLLPFNAPDGNDEV